ncbi:hypothetical protein KUTeg_020881 [Tegillarca granosa]|uniref:Sema domain-containing protein n=1 Tax=Tegillarca granosa TaxID=220873 RepID=A0ABQ9E970_TEGGR|nr:hypothetical protein KUTeg_020881 [Tegillarca granosa]
MIKIQLALLFLIAFGQSFTAGEFYKSYVFKKEYQPITKVSIDQDNGDLFVGGTNMFAHLNRELKVLHMHELGPVNDSQECKPRDNVCIGNVHSNSTETDDIVKVLIYNENRQRLIVCGSAHQGMCFIYIPKTKTPKHFSDRLTNTASYIGGKNTTVVVQSLKRSNDSYDEDIYFIGQSYDGRNVNFFHAEFSKLSFGKIGGSFKLSKYATYTNVSVCLGLKSTFHIRFIHGFEFGNHIYFVFVRSVDGKYGIRTFETKLVQICREDQKFNSLIEIPLSCKTSKSFNMASSAYFDNSGNGTLYVTFGISNRRTGHLQDPLEGSTLCEYQMTDIENKIITVLRAYLLGCKGSTPDWRCETFECVRPRDLTNLEGYCSHHLIKGVQALSEHSLDQTSEFVINGELMTSIAIKKQEKENGHTIAIIGTDKGNILKNPSKMVSHLQSFTCFTYFRNMYLNMQNIFKIDLMSCEIHKTCGDCVTTIDPLGCGWCGNHCSTNNSCRGQWYKNTCPPFVHSVFPAPNPFVLYYVAGYWLKMFCKEKIQISPISGPVSGYTVLTITGNHFGSEMAETIVYLQQFNVTANSSVLFCNITQIFDERTQIDKIICRTSKWVHIVTANKPVTNPTFSKCIGYGPVTVKIDGGLVLNQNRSNFCYMENPEITNIYPHKTIKSGGLSLTIEGNNFNAVMKHEIVVKLYTEGKTMRGKCLSNETTLICPIPKYSGNISDTSFVGSYVVPEFDGMLNFSDNYKGNHNLTFFPDPVLQNLTEDIDVFEKSKIYSVKLKGKNLNLALRKDDFYITINHTRCKVDELKDTYLTCMLKIVGASTQTNAGLSAGVAAAVLLSLVIFVIIIVKKCRPIKREVNGGMYANRDVNGGMYANERSISSIVPPSSLFDEREESQRPRNDDSRYVRYGNSAEARQPLLAEGASGGVSNKLSSFDHGTVTLLEKQNLLIDRNNLVLGENLGHDMAPLKKEFVFLNLINVFSVKNYYKKLIDRDDDRIVKIILLTIYAKTVYRIIRNIRMIL